MGLLLLFIPLMGVLVFLCLSSKRKMDATNVIISVLMLIVGFLLTKGVLDGGSIAYNFFGGFFYVDSLSILILDIVLVIGFLCAVYSVGYLEVELKNGAFKLGKVKTYYILMYSFIFTMVLALTVKNMGIMWIAIEATTLASAFLVGFYNNKKAIEAAWKYVIICSVGIAIALLGIIFLHLSYVNLPSLNGIQLDWTALYQNAKSLNTPILKISFIFILVGFGTKAGLAPMHTWLPDAHSQAPSPISAMLSGVLLNSAMYAIIRTVAILNKNIGSSSYTGRLLIAMGLLSIATAAVFIITQRDYKRLLAYSSIEHMGLIAFSTGIFTPASIFAALLHMVNHSFTKSMLFFSSGSIYLRYETKAINKVNNVLKTLPFTGSAMLLGLFAIAGTPPFSIFTSEFNIIASVFRDKKYLLGILLVMLISLIFVGLAITMLKVFYPDKTKNKEAHKPNEPSRLITLVVMVLLLTITVSGFYIPSPLRQLLTSAQKIIIGG